MGDGFKGNLREMRAAMDAIIIASNKVRRSLDHLEEQIYPTLNQWEGSSYEAYTTAQQKWDGAAKRLQKFLTDSGNAIGHVADIYEQQDLKVKASFEG